MMKKPETYKQEVIIEPAVVIKERGKAGLLPSLPMPSGAILCYDSTFWHWISSLPGLVECDGWLKGSFLISHNKAEVLVVKSGFGAPMAVMVMEELIASGIRDFVNIGSAGGIQSGLTIGDIVICDKSIRDEGTSNHYLPYEKYALARTDITADLCKVMESKGIEYRKGTSWTTDAPYRETVEKFKKYRKEGVLTVEMEASALFAVGDFRKVKVCSAFVISDRLTEAGWVQEYHGSGKIEGLKTIFSIAVELLSKFHKVRKTKVRA